MPRKQYRADLTAASAVPDFGYITEVRQGDDDGDFNFSFTQPGNGNKCQITAMVDTSEYPSTHDYQLFAADDASALIASALQDCPNLSGRPISEALPLLSAFLASRTVSGGQDDHHEVDSDGDVAMPDSQSISPHSDSDDEDGGDNEDWALEDDEFTTATGLSANQSAAAANDVKDDDVSLARARADLRATKAAGFKVGVIGTLSPGTACYVSIACRISKLAISEEAMDAWQLESSEYVILLMYFPHGYRSLDFFESIDHQNGRTRLSMAVGISDSYKPCSVQEAQRAFMTTPDDWRAQKPSTDGNKGYRDCFISKPIGNLLNDRLTIILKYRLAMGFPWSGAERYYNDNLGASRHASDYANAQYSKPEELSTALPAIVSADEISNPDRTSKDLSYPLTAMQFLLRHFVRCTDFCLVCHTKLGSAVEAIKPYVCNNPLCLYQYMSLGFGPSIEHEIIAQPHVVDLLVSFCYNAAASNSLHSYPDGLGLSVPDPTMLVGSIMNPPYDSYSNGHVSQQQPAPASASITADAIATTPLMNARFDHETLELLFEDVHSRCPLHKGQWIAIKPALKTTKSFHCRVVEVHLYPTVKVTQPVLLDSKKSQPQSVPIAEIAEEATVGGWTDVSLHVYNHNINDLDKAAMSKIIIMLLDLLPGVFELKAYLLSKPGAMLSQWLDRISPATLGVLRWIIASNRSCIMQVDRLHEDDTAKRRPEERVQGLEGWLQFRFAMGAPDKEQRFIDSISAETASNQYPTLFAWHGSPLCNWHSIIREGLHFKKTSHGRAYGHGCYHAKDFSVSGGYSGMNTGYGGGSYGNGTWPKSSLMINQAIALSEIINAPEKFVSNNPYYVVAQLDWIQTRYLFARPTMTDGQIANLPITGGILAQDPTRTPTGPSARPLQLPLSAVPKSRRKLTSPAAFAAAGENEYVSPGSKRPSTGAGSRFGKVTKLTAQALKSVVGGNHVTTTSEIDDDSDSVKTAQEDLDILVIPAVSKGKLPAAPPPKAQPGPKVVLNPCTPFQITEIKNLPLTPSPSYATTGASKRLQKDLRNLFATQARHVEDGTLANLGWYVDPDHMSRNENLYQWIAELHSFPLTLPLAKDLQSAKLQSVILEIRFHGSYPMSPPFVRVVRPRFLQFSQGGGGHVTAGGSICSQLLTNDGWTAVSDIESVLLQIRVAITSEDPKPARLESAVYGARGGGRGGLDYGVYEAVDAFRRACNMHGWKVPEGLNEMTASGPGQTGY